MVQKLKKSLMMGAAFLVASLILSGACTNNQVRTIINGICYGDSTKSPPGLTFDPKNPTVFGYQLVFDSEFNDFNDFDTSCTAPPANTGCTNPQGKNWYLDAWTYPVGNNTTNVNTDLSITGGVLKIQQSIYTGNWAITSMGPHGGAASHGPAGWAQNWNGTVFGGGMYAEARIAGEFRTQGTGVLVDAPGSALGHPSIWSYAIDHFNTSDPGGLWPGQGAGYTHFVEADYLDGWQGTTFYQTNLIDWYGTGGTHIQAIGTGMNQFNQVDVAALGFPNPSWHDKTFWHVFGVLWIPATSTTNGYMQNYLDGVKTSRFSWTKYDPNNPPPPSGQNIANIIDQDHLPITLGADPPTGGDPVASMYVDWVHVWQLPAAASASFNPVISPQANFTGGGGSCISP